MCESKKKILVPRAQEKKRNQKNITKKQFAPPPKLVIFFLSAMVANIHLWALFCEQFVPPPNRSSFDNGGLYPHVGVILRS